MPAWVIVLLAVFVVFGLVTAAKGRWGWLLVGLLFGGVLWLVTALMPPAPGSLWARLRARSGPPATRSGSPDGG
jgi:hypothetical protein